MSAYELIWFLAFIRVLFRSFFPRCSFWFLVFHFLLFFLFFFAEDFAYYWNHRIAHESRLFWASHVVHHSSTKYNLSTALRQTWSGSFYTFIFWAPLAIIGFHPLMIVTQISISLLYQYWIHTELIDKMPKWFEA
ncbi:sterol desaturase family protein, partial [Tenacibaculum discolor]|uniref:sterol desaturase family protein n=1 Tax=Tenacibaculum discolor TaxID=361581 RepID=UPI001F39ADD2